MTTARRRQATYHRFQELSVSARGLHSDRINEVLGGLVTGEVEHKIGDPRSGVDGPLSGWVGEARYVLVAGIVLSRTLHSAHRERIIEIADENPTASNLKTVLEEDSLVRDYLSDVYTH